jgi:hypothetical protein
MNVEKIHIQGLNYSVSDRQAAPGVCRELENLFPSGHIDTPVWDPVHNSDQFYKIEGSDAWPFNSPAPVVIYPIKDAYPWKRANRSSMLIYLRSDPINGIDCLCGRQIDSNNNIVVSINEEIFYSFPHTESNDLSFAQISDQLFICISRGGTPFELLQLIESESGTICLPYNIPSPPSVDLYFKAVKGKVNHFSGTTGFLCAWELFDGTIVKPTQEMIIESKGDTGGLMTVKVYKTALEAKWKNIIRGVAVFMTDAFTEAVIDVENAVIGKKQSAIENYLENAVFKKIGLLENIFDTEQELSVELTRDDFIIISDLYDEDNLNNDIVLPNIVSSYNAKLLLADVGVQYSKPAEVDGFVTPPNQDGQVIIRNVIELRIEMSKDPLDHRFRNKSILSWINPKDALSVTIERGIVIYEVFVNFGNQEKKIYSEGWKLLQSNFVGTSYTDTFVYSNSTPNPLKAYIFYRIMARYPDNKFSGYETIGDGVLR